MEITIEHIFAGFIITLTIISCTYQITNYTQTYAQTVQIKNQIKIQDKILSILAPQNKINEILLQALTKQSKELILNNHITYNQLKEILNLKDYSFNIIIKPTLTINLQLKQNKLYYTIKNTITKEKTKSKIHIYTLKNGEIIEDISLNTNGEGIYEFNTIPDIIVAYAINNRNQIGYNYTGKYNKINSTIIENNLKITPIQIDKDTYLIANYTININKQIEINNEIKFETLPTKTIIKINQPINLILPLSGRGKIKIELSIRNETSNTIKTITSTKIQINTTKIREHTIKLNITKNIIIKPQSRIIIKISRINGKIKLYINRIYHPQIILNQNNPKKKLIMKNPENSSNLKIYLITPITIKSINPIITSNKRIEIPYHKPPITIITYSPSTKQYYLTSIPPTKIEIGLKAIHKQASIKTITINNYQYVIVISNSYHNPIIKIENLSLNMQIHPTEATVKAGHQLEVSIYISSKTQLRVKLSAITTTSKIKVSIKEPIVYAPYTTKAKITVRNDTKTGEYLIIFRGESNYHEVTCNLKLIVINKKPQNTFNIILNQNHITLNQGETTTINIYINTSNPQKGKIRLEAENIPENTKVIFNPSIGIPPFQSKCKIIVNSTPPGKYSIIIKGVNENNETKYTVLTLEILGKQEGDFKIIVNPPKIQTYRGCTIRVKISVIPINNFKDKIKLIIQNTPKYTVFYLSPSIGTPPFNSTLTICISFLTQPGTYIVKIIGKSNQITHESQLQLRIIER